MFSTVANVHGQIFTLILPIGVKKESIAILAAIRRPSAICPTPKRIEGKQSCALFENNSCIEIGDTMDFLVVSTGERPMKQRTKRERERETVVVTK